jgi:hypothetical protein
MEQRKLSKLESFAVNTVINSYEADSYAWKELAEMGKPETAALLKQKHINLCRSFLDAIDREEGTRRG